MWVGLLSGRPPTQSSMGHVSPADSLRMNFNGPPTCARLCYQICIGLPLQESEKEVGFVQQDDKRPKCQTHFQFTLLSSFVYEAEVFH